MPSNIPSAEDPVAFLAFLRGAPKVTVTDSEIERELQLTVLFDYIDEANMRVSTLKFSKTGEQIITSGKAQVALLETKITKRKASIQGIIKDQNIKVEDLIQEMSAYGQGQSTAHIAAKDRDVLLTESNLIRKEEEQTKNLKRVIDNIDAKRAFDLTYDELEELGF